MGAQGAPVRVAAAGHAVEIAGDERALAWVEFYVGRWWRPDSSARDVGRIEASVGSLRGAVGAVDGRPFEVVPTFYGVAGRRFAGDDVLVVVDERRLAYRRDGAGRVSIVGEDRTWLEYAAALTTRQLVRGQLESDGWVLVHAACVDGPRGGSLIVGPSGSGKTSTALHLATQGHGLLANDRCFLRARGDRLEALPWPMPLSIGLGLLAALGWAERVRQSVCAGDKQHHFQPQRVTEALEAGTFQPLHDAADHETKYEAYPANLAAWFGIRLVTSSVVRRVLRPRPAERSAGTGDVWRFAGSDVFSGRDPTYPNFLGLPEAPAERLAAAVGAVNGAVAELPQVPLTWRHGEPFAERAAAAAEA